MSDRFRDVTISSKVRRYPCISTPRFNTTITGVSSGAEKANQNWANPLHRFRVPEAVTCMEALEAILSQWFVMGGPFHTWPWRDPLDFASASLEIPNEAPTVSRTDQPIGIGDGVRTQWQLVKTYTAGPYAYTRDIVLPVDGSVLVGIDGDAPGDVDPVDGGPYAASVEREGGTITITPAPDAGLVITAGYLFDCCVRFESDDSYEGIVRAYGLTGSADLTLVETRFC